MHDYWEHSKTAVMPEGKNLGGRNIGHFNFDCRVGNDISNNELLNTWILTIDERNITTLPGGGNGLGYLFKLWLDNMVFFLSDYGQFSLD